MRIRFPAILFVTFFVLLSCGRERVSGPRDVVRDYLEAGKAGMTDAVIATLVEGEREAAREPDWKPMIIQESPQLEYIIGGEIVDGDAASVRVSILEVQDPLEIDYLLFREEEGWKISEQKTLDRLGEQVAKSMMGDLEKVIESLPKGEDSQE